MSCSSAAHSAWSLGAEPGQDRRDGQRVGDIRVAAEPGLAVMPGRRDVIGSPDQAGIGIRPDGLEDLAQPGQRVGLQRRPAAPGRAGRRSQRRAQRARLRRAQGRAALFPVREISARASRACSAPSRVSW